MRHPRFSQEDASSIPLILQPFKCNLYLYKAGRQDGNVELYGAVDSQADKDTAYIRAESVPGVFSVKNYLMVAGQPASENEK